MNILKATAKINALFLTIVLIVGTITLMFPSSITASAQTEQYYGMDKDRKSHGKDISVKLIKCNNINVNVNGLELDGLPSSLTGLLTSGEADNEGQYGASSYGNGERSYGDEQSSYDKNSFKFVCINNNNNTVVEEEEPSVPQIEEECAIDIEACFVQFLNATEFQQLTNALNNGITIQIGENTVTLNSFADICDALDSLTFDFDEMFFVIIIIALEADILSLGGGIFECIAEALGIPITRTLAPESVTSELDVPTILQLR